MIAQTMIIGMLSNNSIIGWWMTRQAGLSGGVLYWPNANGYPAKAPGGHGVPNERLYGFCTRIDV